MLDMWEAQDWKCEHGNPVTSMRYPNGCDECEFTENLDDEWAFSPENRGEWVVVYRNGLYWDDLYADEEVPEGKMWTTAYNEWRASQ